MSDYVKCDGCEKHYYNVNMVVRDRKIYCCECDVHSRIKRCDKCNKEFMSEDMQEEENSLYCCVCCGKQKNIYKTQTTEDIDERDQMELF